MLPAHDHKMSGDEIAIAEDIHKGIVNLINEIETGLPSHRNYSLVITKLEEAKMWLADRYNKTAGG